jgi:hypothetical protein
MFTSISWNEYLFFTTATLFLYYTFIAIRFYKWELLAIAGIRRELPTSKQMQSSDLKRHFISSEPSSGNNAVAIEENKDSISASLKTEITALFANSPETVSLNILSDSLNAVISKYPSLALQQRQDLSRFIYEEAGNYFPGLLKQTDVEQLWFG